jgi:hypothetical protein
MTSFQAYERGLNIRTDDIDTSAVVSEYLSKRGFIPEEEKKKKRAK